MDLPGIIGTCQQVAGGRIAAGGFEKSFFTFKDGGGTGKILPGQPGGNNTGFCCAPSVHVLGFRTGLEKFPQARGLAACVAQAIARLICTQAIKMRRRHG